MIKNRITAILLMCTFILTLIPFAGAVTVSANDVIPLENEKLIIKDFGNPENFESEICAHPTAMASAVAYEGKTSSLRYVMNGVDVNIPINTTERDLAGYNTADTTLNIRFYSEAVGSQFNIIYEKSNSTETGMYYPHPDNNNRLTITGGWQTFTVPFELVYEKTGNTITLKLNDYGWDNKNYNVGDVVYVDSIWLDPTPEYDSMKDPESLVVWDPENGGIDMSNVGVNVLDPYGARGIYRNFERTELTLTVFNRNMTPKVVEGISHDYYTPIFSTEGYNYVNAWVYSPELQDSGFNIRLHSKMKSSGNTINYVNEDQMTTDEYISMLVPQVDWKGWKLISVPLPENKRDIIVLSLGIATYSEGLDKHNYPENNVPLKVGFDGVWLSKGEVSPQSEWEASKSYGNVAVAPYKSSDIPVADYNTPGSIPSGFGLSATSYNSHIYDMAARLSWSTMNEEMLDKAIENYDTLSVDFKSQINIFNTEDPIRVTDNSYINLWMYNPEVKYTLNGTDYAEFHLVICCNDGTGLDDILKPISIMANWTGWKLISIPISVADNENKGLFTTYGIKRIYLGANIGWYTKGVTRTEQQKADGYAFGPANHFVLRELDPDRKNFLDIERVWISDGPVSAGIDITKTDNTVNFCLEHQDYVTLFATEDEFLSVNARAVKTTNTGASAHVVTYSDEKLEFDEKLKDTEKYSVAVEICGTDGVKYIKEFILQPGTYHVMKSETTNSITVSMHGAVPTEYSNAIMVAAVYDRETEEMLRMTPAYVENNTVSVTDDAFNGETEKIKFIFINNFDEIKYLHKEIIA